MNLTLSQIKEITLGAVRVEKTEDKIHFHRFTKQQEELYKTQRENLYNKTFSTSGVQFRFYTDSQTLALRTEISTGSSRTYFNFDVFVDGKMIDSLSNFSDPDMLPNCLKEKLPQGEFYKEFNLGGGEKEVCIYFPWSVDARIKELILDDNSIIKPIKPSKKLLCYGDSITHGYDALHPSNKYITKLATMLDAEEYNKAIGGEIYFPGLALTKEDFEPEYIVVSYGTNDWSRCTRDVLTHNCSEFLRNLKNNYSDSKIFVITPIWRKDMDEIKSFGEFKDVSKVIQGQADMFEGITVINGFNFVPHDEKFYADLFLHPNDKGFECYFEKLSKTLKDVKLV